MSSLRLSLAASLLVSLVASPATAQRDVDVSRFVPAADIDGFIGVPGTRTPGPGRWNVGLTLGYETEPLLALDANGDSIAVISERLISHWSGQLGIGGRLALAVDVPVVFAQSGNATIVDGGLPLASVTVLDPRVQLRYRVYGADSVVERDRNEGPGIALALDGALPVGQSDAFAGEGAFRLAARALASFHVLGAGIGAELGFAHRFHEREVLGTGLASAIEFGFALQIPIPVVADFAGLLELRGATDAESPFGDAATSPVEGSLGFRYVRGDVGLVTSIGTGLTSGIGAPALRATAGVQFAPRVHDIDRDTIRDDRDGCPPLPEDFDGFQDEDGCPDPDNDNDLVLDADDRCPTETAEEDRDEDGDGCTDPIVDTDADGVTDDVDACPGEPEDRDGFEDDDGCADPDNDGDGVPDQGDACPNDAEDRDGFEDDDGCPDLDNDGDGVPDTNDRAPLRAEDVDGHRDDDGVPDLDNDADGVVDANDRCPTELETINGVRDDDGCPDTGGAPALRPVRSREPTLAGALSAALRFAPDGSLATTSARVLNEVAMRLIARSARGDAPLRVGLGVPSTVAADVAEARSAHVRDALVARGLFVEWLAIERSADLPANSIVVFAIGTESPPVGQATENP